MRALLTALLAVVASCSNEQHEAPAAEPVPASFDGAQVTQARVAHGERLSRVLGCRGCHTRSLQGQQFYELYASNLTRDVPHYTDSQLERLIRAGIHPAGRDVWGMPSEIFQHLSDADFEALTAYLRTLTPAGQPTGKPLPLEPETKKLIAAGEIMPAAAFVEKYRNVRPVDFGARHALGRYISEVTCAECHGPKLEGHPSGTPNLIVAGGYTRAEFEDLITRGIMSGNRKFKNPLMGEVARNRFSHLTPHERDALYDYLKARAERPQ